MRIGQTVRLFATLFVLLGAALPARADDAADIRAVITAQLDAFKAGDAEGAYSHAAPAIQTQFGSPENFMGMVERGYGAIYRSSTVTFGEMTQDGEVFRQEVRLSDPRGLGHRAIYVLQRAADGSFRIQGVAMRRSSDIAT